MAKALPYNPPAEANENLPQQPGAPTDSGTIGKSAPEQEGSFFRGSIIWLAISIPLWIWAIWKFL